MAGRAETTEYRPDIDGLRCVAISTVVLSHAGVPWFAGGYVGVDVFFVISGYLITRILRAGLDDYPRSIATFYERRARRILPALMVAVAAVLVAGAWVLGPTPFERLAQSTIATTLFVSNLWFWNSSSDYFGADVRFEPLLHTWSLAVEEQFYIVFPLLLALMARARRRLVRPLIAGICLVSLGMAVHALATDRPQSAFYLLQSRAWELGIGALLALSAIPVPRQRGVVESLAVLAGAGILVPVFFYDVATPFPGLAALPPCVGTAMLIWLGGGSESRVKAALSLSPVVFIGLISYSLYVWHWPIIVFDRILHGEATPGAGAALRPAFDRGRNGILVSSSSGRSEARAGRSGAGGRCSRLPGRASSRLRPWRGSSGRGTGCRRACRPMRDLPSPGRRMSTR